MKLKSILFFLFALVGLALAQTGDYKIVLQDGTVLKGTVLSNQDSVVAIRTANLGELKIHLSKIKTMDLLVGEGMEAIHTTGRYAGYIPNPHPTRYFFAPSAIMLKKGEGYYQNTYLGLNSVNYGLNKYVTIGGGIEIFSTFGMLASNGQFKPTLFITPKVGIPLGKNFYGAIGSMSGYVGAGDVLFGMHYLTGTYGNTERNISVGLGMLGARAQGQVERLNSPVLAFSGMARLTNRLSFVSENWIFTSQLSNQNNGQGFSLGTAGIYSYGLRILGEKISVDLGLLNNSDIFKAIIIGIPYIDLAVNF